MVVLEPVLAQTIAAPVVVVRSKADAEVMLYYRWVVTPDLGVKLLCVVVKLPPDDAFVITAYLTDRTKVGETLWTKP
jgi:hypothetical protein